MDDSQVLDDLFARVEKILKSGEPTKMTRELRDAFLFYTAHQARATNGHVRENRKEIRIHRWVIAITLILLAWHIGLPVLPLPW